MTHLGAPQHLADLQGPTEEDLVLSGPDGERAGVDPGQPPDGSLPGGIDHTTAAAGAGGVGIALLGLLGVLTRRRARRRRAVLDEDE